MSEKIEMSEVQKGIYFDCKTEMEADYNIVTTLQLKDINSAVLQSALNFLIAEQVSLRCCVEENMDGLYLKWIEHYEYLIKEYYCNNDKELEKLVQDLSQKPLDLYEVPLFRAALIEMPDKVFNFFICFHHLISDGISVGIFISKLFKIYDSIFNHSPFLMKKDSHFLKFIEKENKKLKEGKYENQRAYWKKIMEDANSPEIIKDFGNSGRTNAYGLEKRFEIAKDKIEAFQKVVRECEVSEFMFALTAYYVLLYSITGKREFTISSPFTYRPSFDYEESIGCYIYTLPLQCKIEDKESFSSLLKNVRNEIEKAYKNIGYPNNLMVRDRIDLAMSGSSLFDFTFIYDSYEEIQNSCITAIREWNKTVYPGELTVIYQKLKDSAVFKIQYREEHFNDNTIDKFGKRMNRILEQVAENPGIKVCDIDIFLENEREFILSEGRKTNYFEYIPEIPIDIFEKKVKDMPEEIALVSKSGRLTYGQINKAANQLAHKIIKTSFRNHGQKTAAILMERSPEMIISVLAILKAGLAYVPLDISYTKERIDYVVQDAEISVVLTKHRMQIEDRFQGIPLVYVEDIVCESEKNPDVERKIEDLAYIEYTSGTTGVPKGVMIENKSIINTVRDLDRRFPLEENDVYMFKTSITFDISGTEIFGWIVGKGILYVLDAEAEKDPDKILDAVCEFNVTHINFVPSMLRVFLEVLNSEAARKKLSSLKWIFIGGEAVTNDLIEKYLGLHIAAKLENVYGPTECTMWASHYPLRQSTEMMNVSIGKPLNAYRFYVVNEQLKLCPEMVPGELCISGAGLARGYLNKEELTSKMFCPNPFLVQEDPEWYKRMYRTGDLARLLPDGNYEFLGRIDSQVKINGVRIELGEIENAIMGYPGMNQTVVVLKTRENGHVLIGAYYNAAQEIKVSELRSYLTKKLQSFMIPTEFILLDEFPKTSSGKIDRKALINLKDDLEGNSREFAEASSQLEIQIREIWENILGVEKISIDDNFFEIGGHSIALVQVHNRLQNVLGKKFPITVLLNHTTIRLIAKTLSKEEHRAAEKETKASLKYKPAINKDIAIVGMALDVPGAQDIRTFWKKLVMEEDCIHTYTDTELEALGVEDSMIHSPHYVKRKGRIEDLEYFDSKFFHVSPGEVRMISPQLRILYKGMWEAMEDAGISDGRLNDRVGIFMGGSDDFLWYQSEMFEKDHYSDTYQVYTQSTNHFLATRLAYMFDIKGPVMSVLTGCSTSLVTVHEACKSLILGECDAAAAGGITIELPNDGGYLYEPNMMFSKDGKCRPFDNHADGTVFSNGMGIVILKRLEDAIRDKDHIYAVIKGSAISNDGKSKLSYTAPSESGQTIAMQTAYENSGISPETISYVEAHGTGTKLGDPIEVASLTRAFHTEKRQYCKLGSVKGNIGHTDTAAGVIGLIKTALCLKNKYLPPTLNYQEPNENIDFEMTPFIVNSKGTELRRIEQSIPLRAGINSFGVGGTNIHMVLEEAPEVLKEMKNNMKYQLLAVSAKTEKSAEDMAESVIHFMEEMDSSDYSDILYSLHYGRKEFECRKAIVFEKDQDLKEVLTQIKKEKTVCSAQNKKRVCFMFSGQGGQYQGMGRDLLSAEEDSPVCHTYQTYVNQLLQYIPKEEREQFKQIIWGDEASDTINQTKYSQMALFITEYSMAMTLISIGIIPDFLVGHSIGEVTAAAVAGVWSAEDAVKVVYMRGSLMQKQKTGAMLSVNVSEEGIGKYLKKSENVWISLCNTTNQCVLGGTFEGIEKIGALLKQDGIESKALRTSHAFHTPMMEAAASEFENFLDGLEMSENIIPIISNLTGKFANTKEMCKAKYWAAQIVSKVRFEEVLDTALKEEDTVLIETAGRTLCSMAKHHKSIKTGQAMFSLVRHPKEKRNDIEFLTSAIGKIWSEGISINWSFYFGKEQVIRVPVPTYAFEKNSYPVRIMQNRAGSDFLLNESEGDGFEEKQIDYDTNEIMENVRIAFQNLFGLDNLKNRDDFFELGGDSLQAASLAARLKKIFGIEVKVSDIFSNPTVEKMSAYVESNKDKSKSAKNEIRPVGKKEYYPVSAAQKRMYVFYLMDKDNIAYNLPSATVIEGKLNKEKVEEALEKLIFRHEALRTSFEIVEGQTVQRIADKVELPLVYSERDINLDNPIEIDRIAKSFVRPFDLSKVPLFRVELIKTTKNRSLLLFDLHHIIADGTSVELLTRDFNQLYSGELEPLTLQYKDYAIWQETYMKSEEMLKQEDFWLEYLDGELPELELPLDFERPQIKNLAGGRYEFSIDPELFADIKELGKKFNATNFMVTISAWFILLARYSRQEEVIVGTPSSGRNLEEIKDCVGMFINMLPIRAFPEEDKKYADFLVEVKEDILKVLANQDYQFDVLVDKLNIPRRLDRNALFDVAFDYHNMQLYDIEIENIRFSQKELFIDRVADELLLTCCENSDQVLNFYIEYSTALFKESTIKQFARTYIEILKSITKNTESCISDIRILSDKDRTLLENLNSKSRLDFREDIMLSECFEHIVSKYPDKTALIVADGTQYTYHKLNEAADCLAWRLVEYGAGKDVAVAMIPRRNAGLIISMLGILKSGAAYVPIDISYPVERMNDILERSNSKIVLCPKELEDKITFSGCILDIDAETIVKENTISGKVPVLHGKTESTAYILFTSGSSGKPKGVAVTQRNVLNFIADNWNRGIINGEQDRIFCVTTPSFDIFGFESIVPLCSGGLIYMADDTEQLDAAKAAEKIVKYQLTHFLSAVSRVRGFVGNKAFLPALHTLKYILSGGESYPDSLLHFLQKNSEARIYNMYGPTETTIWSTAKELTDAESVTIGTPIANTQVYIIDEKGHIQPPGVFGEICIGGAGVAKGYVNMPEETNKRYITLAEKPDIRIYRTGDRARILRNGEIEIAGRIDSQVKIRGYRVELDEIEKTVLNSGYVKNAAVLASDSASENKQLILFYSSENEEDQTENIKSCIAKRLPMYMMPARFVRLDEIPLLVTGKVNKKALKIPVERLKISEKEKSNPQNELEKKFLEIWQEILENSEITVKDNFFDVGGNSFSLMLVLNRINEYLGTEISLMKLFEFPTISSFVESLNLQDEEENMEIEPVAEIISGDVAVIGMTGRFPQAENIDEFWHNVLEGKNNICSFTEDELRESGISEEELKNPDYVKAKGYLDGVEYFDAGFFGYTPKEAEEMDPQIRLLLGCVWNALEDACCDPYSYPGKIALFAGSSSNVAWIARKFGNQKDIVDTFSTMTLNDKDFLTTQISYKLNLKGPSVNIQTACSTSLVAIHQAVAAINEKETDVALAGGVSITYPRKEGYTWHESMIYSRDGVCRPFSEEATGTVAGNGCGVVVLKALDKAVKDGDHIYAVIKGSAVNNDGFDKVGYTAPGISGQKNVIETALLRAGVPVEEIGFVQTHGTGTGIGDPIEIEALKQAWNTKQKSYCAVGAVKANIGHLDAASGVAGFINAVQVLYNRRIPPLANYLGANPLIEFPSTPFYIPEKVLELSEKYHFASVSAFGIGGTNAYVIISEPPVLERKKGEDMSVLMFSAKSEEALNKTMERDIRYMRNNRVSISDFSYTLRVGRAEFPIRKFIVLDENTAVNEKLISDFLQIPARNITEKKEEVVFIYPGESGTICKLGVALYSMAHKNGLFEKFCQIFEELLENVNWQMRKLAKKLLEDHEENKDAEEIVTFLTLVAVTKIFYFCGMKPDRILYQGKGIFAAYAAAGILPAEKLIKHLPEYLKGDQTWILEEAHSCQGSLNIEELTQENNQNAFIAALGAANDFNTNTRIDLAFEEEAAGDSLLKVIGELWCIGCRIDLKKLGNGNKISIPGYVFKKESYEADVNLAALFSGKNEASELAENRNSSLKNVEEMIEVLENIWKKVLGEMCIDRSSDFFEAGGDSLRAIKIASLIKEAFHISISSSVIFEHSVLKDMANWIFEHRENESFDKIERVGKKTYYETSAAQKRLYTAEQFITDATPYNLASVYCIEGELDLKRLQSTFLKLAERHEAFRTHFGMAEGEVVQYVEEYADSIVEYEKKPVSCIEKEIEDFVRPFDLEHGPLVRIKVISSSEKEHYFMIDMHHIISDQTSIGILMQEFAEIYAGKELQPQKISYKDFAAWQNKIFQTGKIDSQLQYWMKQFEDGVPRLDLLKDFIAPDIRTYRGKVMHFSFSKDQNFNIHDFTLKKGITAYMLMIAALNILLWKYTSQKEILLGTAVAGRDHADLSSVVGMFVNILVVLTKIDSTLTVEEFLEYIKENMVSAYDNQDCPYDLLVDAVRKEKEEGFNSLFDVAINYINMGTEELSIDGCRLSAYESTDISVKYDLMFVVEESQDSYKLDIEYASELYSEETIKQLGNRFITLIDELIGKHNDTLQSIGLALSEEDREAYRKLNHGYRETPAEKNTIISMFEDVVRKNGKKTAVIFQDEEITYQKLNEMVNQLACELSAEGIGYGRKAAILLECSPLQIISILAILKCGAVYVPIDPSYPLERIAFMLEDSKSEMVVTNRESAEKCKAGEMAFYIEDINFNVSVKEEVESECTPKELSLEDEAYIIYTSGSTGRPKGVVVTEKGIMRIAKNPNYITITEEDKLLQLANYAFDGSVFEIFGTLLNGAAFIMVPKSQAIDIPVLADIIAKKNISMFFMTTALFNLLVDYDVNVLSNVRRILVGGESLSVRHMRRVVEYLGPGRVANIYGPTETTVFAAYYTIDEIPENMENIPIGHAVSNTSLYVLDKEKRILPSGVPGELYIGGSGVAKEYLNNEQLTEEKFIQLDFGRKERVYKTGDRVKMTSAGELVFLGRTDFQIKLNGFRIELEEIEKQIDSIEGIKEILVKAQKDRNGSIYIAAYYTVQSEKYQFITPEYIREYLLKVIPEYMVPSRMLCMDKLPLTSNGKIDRIALPEIEYKEQDLKNMDEEDVIEDIILSIMCKILDNPTFNAKDNFFLCGGQSIKAIALTQALREKGFKLSINDIFKNPTAEQLSALPEFAAARKEQRKEKQSVKIQKEKLSVQEITGESEFVLKASALLSQEIKALPVICKFNMAPVQKIHQQSKKVSSGMHFHIHDVKSENKLKNAVMKVIAENQLLHSFIQENGLNFVWQEHEVKESISRLALYIVSADTSTYEEETRETFLKELQKLFFDSDYNVQELPFRVCCVKLEEDGEYLILWAFNHVCFDGMSAEIIRREIIQHMENMQPFEMKQREQKQYSRYVEFLNKNVGNVESEKAYNILNPLEWKQWNHRLMQGMDHIPGNMKKLELNIPLEKISKNVWQSAMKYTAEILSGLLGLDNVPFVLVNYARIYEKIDFNDCIGEFLDLVPVLISGTGERAEEEVTNVLSILKSEKINILSEISQGYGRTAKELKECIRFSQTGGDFVLFNYQGYVAEEERSAFVQNAVLEENDSLAKLMVTACNDDHTLVIAFESVSGLDLELIKNKIQKMGMPSDITIITE